MKARSFFFQNNSCFGQDGEMVPLITGEGQSEDLAGREQSIEEDPRGGEEDSIRATRNPIDFSSLSRHNPARLHRCEIIEWLVDVPSNLTLTTRELSSLELDSAFYFLHHSLKPQLPTPTAWNLDGGPLYVSVEMSMAKGDMIGFHNQPLPSSVSMASCHSLSSLPVQQRLLSVDREEAMG